MRLSAKRITGRTHATKSDSPHETSSRGSEDVACCLLISLLIFRSNEASSLGTVRDVNLISLLIFHSNEASSLGTVSDVNLISLLILRSIGTSPLGTPEMLGQRTGREVIVKTAEEVANVAAMSCESRGEGRGI